jgi:hypothetical protein
MTQTGGVLPQKRQPYGSTNRAIYSVTHDFVIHCVMNILMLRQHSHLRICRRNSQFPLSSILTSGFTVNPFIHSGYSWTLHLLITFQTSKVWNTEHLLMFNKILTLNSEYFSKQKYESSL